MSSGMSCRSGLIGRVDRQGCDGKSLSVEELHRPPPHPQGEPLAYGCRIAGSTISARPGLLIWLGGRCVSLLSLSGYSCIKFRKWAVAGWRCARYVRAMAEQQETPTSVRYRTYAGGSRMAMHWHSQPSLTLVLGGDYQEAMGGRTTSQNRGSVLVCPEGQPHAQQFGPRGARKFIVTPGSALLDYLVTTTPFRSAPAACSSAIGRLAARIDAERRTDDPFSKGAIEGLVWQVAAELGRGLAAASVPTSAIVRRACALIQSLEGQPISVAALCRELGCHPATLTRAFRRQQGCTPGEYQRRMRVGKAADMLAATRLPIAEIAASCGFCDQAHLARSFHAVLGCSPSDYRRRV